jgi:hypothetical protein
MAGKGSKAKGAPFGGKKAAPFVKGGGRRAPTPKPKGK